MSTDLQPQGNGFDRNRLRSLAPIVLFDVGGPLALYWLLRLAGTSDVTALIASGILPAIGVALGIIRRRRVDVIGALVLLGIVVGTIFGLTTHSARLVMMEGSVPTALFGLTCLGSLLTSRPMLLRVALDVAGDSEKGRELAARVALPGVQHTFRMITLVWGVAYLAEAAARIGIVETASTGTALLIVKVMPWLVTGLLMRWMMRYIRQARQQAVVAAEMTAAPAVVADPSREPAMAR
jgi:intracellular septation protein A